MTGGSGEVAHPLGRLIVLTDRSLSEVAGRSLVDTVVATAVAGAPIVLFREKDLPPPERKALGHEVAAALVGTGTRLLVASDVSLARRLGAYGVHLSSHDPAPTDCSTDRSDGGLLAYGRSCHNTGDVTAAAEEGVSWATLSPVFLTESKPGYGPPLGTQPLGGSTVAVFALGGVTPSRVEACVAAGAHGVAMMGAIMSAPDPTATVQQVLEVLA